MNELIIEFIALVIEHGKTKNDGNYKRGNKIHDKIMKIVGRIKSENELIRKQFYVLMYHEHPYVSLWASSSLLKTFEQEALTVLKKLKENQDVSALDAELLIGAWGKGFITNIENRNQ
jgi:hypothetical protein